MPEREAVDEAVEAPAVAQPLAGTTPFGAALPARLMALQRTAGNRAVVRILARDAWSDAVKYDKWMDAAKSLNDLKDKDVNDRLAQPHLGQLGALPGGTRDWGTSGNGETVWDDKTNARIRELIY